MAFPFLLRSIFTRKYVVVYVAQVPNSCRICAIGLNGTSQALDQALGQNRWDEGMSDKLPS